MSFTSVAFLFFVIGTALVYFLVPKKIRWIVLLVASYAFYLLSSPNTFVFVLTTTATTFYGGKKISAYETEFRAFLASNENNLEKDKKKELKKANKKKKQKVLITIMLVNFGILAFLKYFRVYLNSIAGILGFEKIFDPGILIPLGISFYTFQSMSYLIDVFRGKFEADTNIAKFALFVSFFPQIVQGPISRYNQLANQLFVGHEFDYTRITFGVQLILWGFFKKLVIADRVGVLVNQVFDNYTDYHGFIIILAVVGYTIQIYADFSGGMEIARGVSQIFGIDIVKNFERPYFSTSIPEFWRRWHITLGQWCRDYIFYPISLSPTFGRLGKKSRSVLGDRIGKLLPVIIAQLITFLVIGIWHGAQFKFVAYGLYQAIFIVGGILLEPYFAKLIHLLRINTKAFSWKIFQICRTFLLIVIGRFFSRGSSFLAAIAMMKASLVFNPNVFFDGSIYKLGLSPGDFNVLGVALLVLFSVSVMQENGIQVRKKLAEQNILFRWLVYIVAVLFVMIFGMYGSGYDVAGFIYRAF